MLRISLDDRRFRRPVARAVSAAFALLAGLAVMSPAWSQSKPASPSDALLPLCTAGTSVADRGEGALGLYDVGGGKLAADFVDADAAAKCLKATSGNLALDIGGIDLNLNGSVQYSGLTAGPRRINATTLNPALCESYYGGTAGFGFALRNANNDLLGANGVLGGVASLSYDLASGGFVPDLMQATYGPWLRCFDATLPNVLLGGTDAHRVFGARFESDADLVVQYLDQAGAPLASDELLQTIGASSVYKVRISNRGEGAANNVRIREFVPKAGGQLDRTMSTGGCLRDADNQSCAAADGTLSQDVASLAPGQSVTYTLTRTVAGTTPLAAAGGALTAVAAFVDPQVSREARAEDNTRHLRVGLVSLPQFVVNTSVPGGGGTLSPGNQSVTQGNTAQFTLAPAANHQIASTSDNCGAGGAVGGTLNGTQYSIPNITAACTVTATFALVKRTVTSSGSNANGTISPATQQVDHGTSASFTVTTAGGYSAALGGTCGTVTNNGNGTWSTAAVTADCAVTASFSQNSYVVAASSSGNGTITPASQNIFHGGTASFTVTPDANYVLAGFTGTCAAGITSGNQYFVTGITANCSVVANFALVTYAVTAAATSNGSIGIAPPQVAHGGTATITPAPANGYELVAGSVAGTAACGTLVDNGNGSWTTGAITAAGCEISAAFQAIEYDVTVTMTGGNGTIGDPAGTTPLALVVAFGNAATFDVTPATGYDAVVDGDTCNVTDNNDGSWTTGTVSEDCNITVSFTIQQFVVTGVVSGGNGTITASRTVDYDDIASFTVTPASGFQIDTVVDDCAGGSATSPGSGSSSIYTVFNVTAACTVTATFVPLPN